MSREDIARTGIEESSQLATIAAIKQIDDRCEAVIDGGPRVAPLWTFGPSDIEMMEVYTQPVQPASTAQNVAKVLGGRPPDNRGLVPAKTDCGATIFVWLRK